MELAVTPVSAGAATAAPVAQTTNNQPEEQAGHDKPSFYPHTHAHAQSALYPRGRPQWRVT